MKIFEGGEGWGLKVNFVDENNVFLGYDLSQCCCENANWFIADEVVESLPDSEHKDTENLEGWSFDTSYKKDINYIEVSGINHRYNALDEGAMVVFRITKDGKEKFIHLYNVHNGYYGHGFEFKINEEEAYCGSL